MSTENPRQRSAKHDNPLQINKSPPTASPNTKALHKSGPQMTTLNILQIYHSSESFTQSLATATSSKPHQPVLTRQQPVLTRQQSREQRVALESPNGPHASRLQKKMMLFKSTNYQTPRHLSSQRTKPSIPPKSITLPKSSRNRHLQPHQANLTNQTSYQQSTEHDNPLQIHKTITPKQPNHHTSSQTSSPPNHTLNPLQIYQFSEKSTTLQSRA